MRNPRSIPFDPSYEGIVGLTALAAALVVKAVSCWHRAVSSVAIYSGVILLLSPGALDESFPAMVYCSGILRYIY